jgi:hypothetical protein
MGNGSCEHPSPSSDLDLFDSDSPDLLLSQMNLAEPFLDRILAESQEEGHDHSQDDQATNSLPATSEIARPVHQYGELLGEHDGDRVRNFNRAARRPLDYAGDDEEEDDDEEVAQEDSADPKKAAQCRCGRCMVRAVKWVMHHAMKGLDFFCNHTKCPRAQKFCQWAESHRGFVKGMMYAKIEPYKAAGGWCAGRGKCGGERHSHDVEESDVIAQVEPITTVDTIAPASGLGESIARLAPSSIAEVAAETVRMWKEERAARNAEKKAHKAQKKSKKQK